MGRKREQTSEGIRQDLEKPEGLLPQQEETLQRIESETRASMHKAQQEEDAEEEDDEEPEKLNRTQCAQRVIADIDGDTTISELAEKADALYRASRPDAKEDTDTASWYIQKQLEVLEGMSMLTIRWEAVIHPEWTGKLSQLRNNRK